MIAIHEASSLDPRQRDALRQLLAPVYHTDHLPGLTTPCWWAVDWSDRGEALACVGLVERVGLCDGDSVTMGGIARVRTRADQRKMGRATALVSHANAWFRDRGVAFVELMCDQPLAHFYERLGFEEFTGVVVAAGPLASAVMVYPLAYTPLAKIDLCGNPW